MLEGMAIDSKPMKNKGNKIFNVCIKTKTMIYLHLIYLYAIYQGYMGGFVFFFTNSYFISL